MKDVADGVEKSSILNVILEFTFSEDNIPDPETKAVASAGSLMKTLMGMLTEERTNAKTGDYVVST